MTLFLSMLLACCVWVATASANECDETCIPCHGNSDNVHGNYDHAAVLGSGTVAIFADTDHDDAGWYGDRPYFGVAVDCSLCHNNFLPTIHGNVCVTCHPTPYDSLGIWGKGCQQGGCHPFYHQDVTTAHLPFENAYDTANDCNRCHDQAFAVPQSNCLNCHAAFVPGDVTPPVTTSDVQVEYYGPAQIEFTITKNGKVGLGRTFYRLDGGPETAAGKTLSISALGAHQLEFWSMDQSGTIESAPNQAFFTITEDNIPPVTTSNAQANYTQGAVIILTATDDSIRGVKTTYYRVNDGPIQGGTTVVIPATSGVIAYTLAFWSEDWAGNIETQKSVNFTVTSGGGVLRLVWGNSDASGSPCSGDPDAEAAWTIRRGNTVVATGSGACPNWSGVNDVTVQASATPYSVIVDWWDSYYEYWDQSSFSNVYVSTPGQVVRIGY